MVDTDPPTSGAVPELVLGAKITVGEPGERAVDVVAATKGDAKWLLLPPPPRDGVGIAANTGTLLVGWLIELEQLSDAACCNEGVEATTIVCAGQVHCDGTAVATVAVVAIGSPTKACLVGVAASGIGLRLSTECCL